MRRNSDEAVVCVVGLGYVAHLEKGRTMLGRETLKALAKNFRRVRN